MEILLWEQPDVCHKLHQSVLGLGVDLQVRSWYSNGNIILRIHQCGRWFSIEGTENHCKKNSFTEFACDLSLSKARRAKNIPPKSGWFDNYEGFCEVMLDRGRQVRKKLNGSSPPSHALYTP